MKKTTKLRLIGGAVIFLNLMIIGYFNLEGIPVILMTFGFAIGYEYLAVKPAKSQVETDKT